jgi:hypothetical protein
MNEQEWTILIQFLDEIVSLLGGPPEDATCETCRWFMALPRAYEDFDGKCMKDGRVYVGDEDEDMPCFNFPGTDLKEACRHWEKRNDNGV